MDDRDLTPRVAVKTPFIIRQVLKFKKIPRSSDTPANFYKILWEITLTFMYTIFITFHDVWEPMQVTRPLAHRLGS